MRRVLCGAKVSDDYWDDHSCGLKNGHENLPLDDPDRSTRHQCHAVYWEPRVKRKALRVTKPCGFSWKASASPPDEILEYTRVHAES
jgi:hypothetical protein